MPNADLAAVVLAAGQGTRFKSDRAKVLHEAAGRSLLGHVLDAVAPLGCAQVVVVVGHQADEVGAAARASDVPGLTTVVQERQLGTGDAVARALPALDAAIRRVLVVPGDVPLLTAATLERLVAGDTGAATLLTAEVDDPTGYGRVVLSPAGGVQRIVEDADATAEHRAVHRVNTSVYVFDRARLAAGLERLDTDNEQGELYLTDVPGILAHDGEHVGVVDGDPAETAGVNDRVQLAAAAAGLRTRALEQLMLDGVTVVDPAATHVDVGVRVGRDTVVHPGCVLEGDTVVGDRAVIGPHSHLVDAVVEDDASVAHSVVEGASIGPAAEVGPFSYLRPGTRLERDSKAGGFVEIKQSTIGEGSKVPHLSYVGDTTMGRDVNIGAGTVTCNFDGFDKHQTVIGDGVFVGSDTMLVAPVTLGDGAVTGAASAITEDVPADALAVERGEQRNVEGWAKRRRDRRGGA